MDHQFQNAWARLKAQHTHERDGLNNFECFNVEGCRNCSFVRNSRGCTNCHNCDSLIECLSCVDCRDCAYSVGLNGARFHILNVEYDEQEYYQRLTDLEVDWKVSAIDRLDAEQG